MPIGVGIGVNPGIKVNPNIPNVRDLIIGNSERIGRGILSGGLSEFFLDNDETPSQNKDTEREDKLRQEDREWYDLKRKEEWEREDMLWLEQKAREDTAFQRAFEDLKATGMNPAAIFQMISPAGTTRTVSTASSGGAPGKYNSNLERITVQREANLIKFMGSILSFIGAVLPL